MKPSELIERIAQETNVPKVKVKAVVQKTLEILAQDIASGEKTNVPGFGTFITTERPATTNTNPETGETVEVPAKTVTKFRPGKKVKEQGAANTDS